MARKGWNGKKQYIQLATGISYKTADNEIVNCEHDAIGNKAIAFVGTSGVQMGWLYKYGDGFKFQALGSGYTGGMTELFKNFGLDIDEGRD